MPQYATDGRDNGLRVVTEPVFPSVTGIPPSFNATEDHEAETTQ